MDHRGRGVPISTSFGVALPHGGHAQIFFLRGGDLIISNGIKSIKQPAVAQILAPGPRIWMHLFSGRREGGQILVPFRTWTAWQARTFFREFPKTFFCKAVQQTTRAGQSWAGLHSKNTAKFRVGGVVMERPNEGLR